MGYERMTGMGTLDVSAEDLRRLRERAGFPTFPTTGGITTMIDAIDPTRPSYGSAGGAGGTETAEYRQCLAAGGRIGTDYRIPEGCISSGTWSAVGRSMPEWGYCCPRPPSPLPPTVIGTKVESCRPGNTNRETVEICLDRSRDCSDRTIVNNREMRSRGCNLSYTSGSRQHWCCPPVVQQQVSRGFSRLERIPPWQLILGTGLIVGGAVWFYSNMKKYREAYPARNEFVPDLNQAQIRNILSALRAGRSQVLRHEKHLKTIQKTLGDTPYAITAVQEGMKIKLL